MRTLASTLAAALVTLSPFALRAQTAETAEPPFPPPVTQPQPQPPPPQVAPAPAPGQGEWVYTAAYGWVWVPTNTSAYDVGSQPYVYLYTPSFGWTWYVSPWGYGRFYRGPWVSLGWGVPRVWHGHNWIAPPAVRIGPRPPGYYRGYGHGPYWGGHYHAAPAYRSPAPLHAAPPVHMHHR